jgi:predicted metal-binding integral membrane protein DUF2182
VRVHVGDGRDADARRLDDVDGVLILLVIGVVDLRAMAVVAAAMTVERLAPAGKRVARASRAVVVGAGLFLIARAARLATA